MFIEVFYLVLILHKTVKRTLKRIKTHLNLDVFFHYRIIFNSLLSSFTNKLPQLKQYFTQSNA